MWVKKYSKVYESIKKEDIWRVWSDVNKWPLWDSELEYCKLNAPFEKGSQFILKPIGASEVEITLSEIVIHERFIDYCKFFGATMYDDHELEETPEGLRITNTISVTGPLRFIWVHLVAKNIAASVPAQMDALVNFARLNHG